MCLHTCLLCSKHTQTTQQQGLHLVDSSNGAKRNLPVNGMFYGIGHQPNSKLVAGYVDLDEAGYVKVGGVAVIGNSNSIVCVAVWLCMQNGEERWRCRMSHIEKQDV